MNKCKRCGRELRSEESIKRGFGKRCYRIVQLNQKSQETITSDITELLNRIRKLELDNNFIKTQLKHKRFTTTKHSDEDLDWNIKPEVKEKIDTYKIEFNVIVKELRVYFNSNQSILKKDFRYSDEELGIKPMNVREEPEELPPIVENLELIH
ncbi:unnamed protein product [marine sediment metagenome]|uniref:Uncharacterized protein n=1 Tax=marine sediment metagenome TaxID=412755 RepID=X1AI72_9ZZZZ